MEIKPRRLKKHVPRTPEEWLEYQEHRDRWTPEMQKVLDQRIKDFSPVTEEDKRIAERFEKRRKFTLHYGKPS